MSHTVLSHTDWQATDGIDNNYVVPLAEDRLLVFAIALANNPDTDVTGVTWGGQSLTQGVSIVTTAIGEKSRAELWYLKEADIVAAGDQDGGFAFQITWSAGVPSNHLSCAGSYKFVDQTTPIDNTLTVEDSSVPIDNPIEGILIADPGSLTVSLATCGNIDGDIGYYWDPFWNERIDQDDGTITMSTSDRIVSSLTPQTVSADFQGTVTTRQALCAMGIHPSSTEFPEIRLDSAAGGAINSGTVVEFDIVIADNPNRLLVISPAYEFEIDETGYTTLVQVNGEDAVFVGSSTAGCPEPGVPVPECIGIHNTSYLYYFTAPPDGTSTIRVEVTMDVGIDPRDMMVAAACIYNVGPPDILSIKTDFDNEPLPTVLDVQHPTGNLTGNSVIVDSIVMGNPLPPMTALSNQIKIADQQGIGTTSSRSTLAIKYSESTPLGESNWEQSSQPGNPGLRAAIVSMAIDSYSDSTAPSFICTDTTLEDVTLEFCEDRNLFRMNVTNQGDNVDMDFEFDTCTLQILNIITSGTSSRNIRFTFNGTPTDFTPNDIEDVSSQNIFFTVTGPYYLPTLVLEGEYSITFI
jgi:hypothetical protein